MIEGLTNIEPSFPVEVATVNREGQIHVTSGIDARHNANSTICIDVLSDHVLGVEAADDAPVGVKARAGDINHHATHHVSTLWGEN